MSVPGEAEAAALPFEEWIVDRCLQLLQPQRQRRLRNVQPIRGLLDASQLGRPPERLQLPDRKVIHRQYLYISRNYFN
jgi:hypothetical protein